ncbi:hypothetical protein LPJ61_003434 [Coemansia biformis]|uniref:Uncharacterized protein n=1 Tax=Coemansia biformis TaxID=1286918 RepID=A0A9W7YB81_9FUNG|nr:hypothetical protein LPJ61_003434 [Coemansia biformis]
MTVPLPQFADAVYDLTPADGNPASRANLQFVLFYRTAENVKHRVSASLREAFYRVLTRYPILFGRIERCTKGHSSSSSSAPAHVVVSKNPPAECMPRYEEIDVGESIEDIQRADYNWAAWPPALLSICPVRRPSTETQADDPLVWCIVTWHKDGMGILFSVDHSVTDGVGIDILLNQWAHAVRDPPAEANVVVDYDHASVFEGLSRDEPESDWFVRHIDSVDLSKTQGACGAILESDPRSAREVELALFANVHSVRITPEAMERLHSDATKEDRQTGGAKHVSLIRLAYALVWQRYTLALQEVAPWEGSDCLLNIIHSVRHLVDRPHYIGNAVCPVYMKHSAAALRDMSLCQIAETIGNHMHSVTGPQWLAFLLMLQDSDRYAKFLTVFASPESRQLSVSNISRLGFFGVDFGFGIPAHVTVYPMMVPGFATWLPLSGSGGLHIVWNMTDAVAARLKNDPLFTRYADLLF